MRKFGFQRVSIKKLKTVAFSIVVMMSSAFLYNNCSNSGFQAAGSGDSNLASSSEPTVTSVAFRSGPSDSVNTNSIDFTYDISGDNTSAVSAKCYLDQTLQADCSSPIDLSAKPDGDYTLTVAATSQNNMMLAQAKRSFRLDRKAPVVTIHSAPSGTINVTSASIAFSVTDNFPGAVAYCSLDSAAFAVCTSPLGLSNLAQGSHNVKIYAQDKASNKSATQTISFSVNTAIAIPSVAISQMPAVFSNSASASFSFSGSSTGSTIASYQCSMDNSAFAACTSPQAYSSLAEGSHSFSVKSVDATGQSSSPANYSFSVDLTKPSTPVVSSNQMNPTVATSLNLTFNSTDISGINKYECKLDNGVYSTCVSPQAFSGLSVGSHSFMVRATDRAGNVSADGSYSIVIQAPTPVPTPTPSPSPSPSSVGYPATPVTTLGNTYYISVTGSDSNPGTKAAPWKTFCKADMVVKPGDTVRVMSGTYDYIGGAACGWDAAVFVSTSGTATAPITYISDVKWGAKLRSSKNLSGVRIYGHYITFADFDVSIGSAEPAYPNGMMWVGIFATGSGIRVLGNRVHDIPNEYGCANFGGAGIVGGSYNTSDRPGTTGQEYASNMVFNVGTAPNCVGVQTVHGLYIQTIGAKISNNIVFGNSTGGGITLNHCYSKVTITNNILWKNLYAIVLGNNVDAGCAANTGTEVNNNIIRDETPSALAYGSILDKSGGVDYARNNILFNTGGANSSGINEIGTIKADPMFVNFQLDGSGDYHLKPGSPAIDRGTTIGAPALDFDYQGRPKGSAPDIGAFEN